jgi:hypothetical protein
MVSAASWYESDKKGLERIARRRGLTYVLFELLQNAWDTVAKEVKVSFEPVDGRPLCDVTVADDDPDGFVDLSHAWTLFAESAKKGDPQKRGRFNFGEKLVLAVCESAEIVSTTGNVRFDDDGRHVGRRRTEKGSVFSGRVRMTREELAEVRAAAHRLLPPPGIATIVDGETLQARTPIKSLTGTLSTVIADADGFLVSRQRETRLDVYAAMEHDEDGAPSGWLYELGIPVCPTGDHWDVNIAQKVPVNLERNSVSEAYLRTVRVLILNEMFGQLKPEDAVSPAIQEALTDSRVKPDAVEAVLTHQFGEKRAIWDPSDLEANRRLVADGYTVIPGNTFSKPAWQNIRASGAALPSGKILPTPKPYSDDPNAPMAQFIPEDEWTAALRTMAEYAAEYGWRLIHRAITVRFEKGRMTSDWAANYGAATLTFNYERLGKSWFERGPREDVNALLIHEFAHQAASNHLSTEFYHELQRLGAKSTDLALRDPEFFHKHGYKASR